MSDTNVAEATAVTSKDFKGKVDPDWCPGCGDFGLLNSVQKALAELGRQPHEVLCQRGERGLAIQQQEPPVAPAPDAPPALTASLMEPRDVRDVRALDATHLQR